jgi:Domain of unknown function (DUF4349)
MTPSPDLQDQLRASRPAAPPELRAKVREIAREQPAPVPVWRRLRLPERRIALVALPAAAALALVSAGALGLSRSDPPATDVRGLLTLNGNANESDAPERTPPWATYDFANKDSAVALSGAARAADSGRAQRIAATLSVEVAGSDAVARASQDALDLTRQLGGYVVSSAVTTGDDAQATLTVRVPVARVQDAVVGLSALGRIVSQQVTIDDLQATLNQLARRERSLVAQIAVVRAKLDTGNLDEVEEARLRARLATLTAELRQVRRGERATDAEAATATIRLTVVTPETGGAAPPPPSRLDRTLDEALNVLVWEGVVALAIAIVAAPFLLVALAAWLGGKLYRRRQDERLLAT